MNLVYFAQTQFITNHNILSTKQDQTHTQIIEIMLFILEFHALITQLLFEMSIIH